MLKVKSTFPDYWHPFCERVGDYPTLVIHGGNSGPPKPQQFAILEEAGFVVPPHGKVCDLIGKFWDTERTWIRTVVVYEDENAHCGDGKFVLMERQLKIAGRMSCGKDPRFNLYCSAFVGAYPVIGPSCSWRRLQIGEHVFWIEYTSNTDWRSNCGEGDNKVIGVEWGAGYHSVIRRPLWAVDFVISSEMYAVDLNFGPGIRGSGVEKILSGPECVKALRKAMDELN